MKLKKLAALALAGVLCLTTFAGCGANADETAATLGDQQVSAGVVNFICKYQKASMDDMYISSFGEDIWEQDLYGNGTTLEEDFKDSVMTSLHDLYTLKAHMTDYNVEITEEDEAAIKKAAQAFIATNSEEAIKEFGASEEIVTEVLKLYTIQAKMYNAIVVNTDRNVSDEEATEENREAIIAERENQLYRDTLDEWQKEDGWTVNEAVVSKIEFHNILTQNTEEIETTEGK